MSTPGRPEPDPFSLALGRIEGRLDGLEKRLDGIDHRLDRLEAHMATTAELRVWGGLMVLLLGALLGKLWGVLG
jgi:hypothetical protein